MIFHVLKFFPLVFYLQSTVQKHIFGVWDVVPVRRWESSRTSAHKPLSKSCRAEYYLRKPGEARRTFGTTIVEALLGLKCFCCFIKLLFITIFLTTFKTLCKVSKKSGGKMPQLKCVTTKIMLSLMQIIVWDQMMPLFSVILCLLWSYSDRTLNSKRILTRLKQLIPCSWWSRIKKLSSYTDN